MSAMFHVGQRVTPVDDLPWCFCGVLVDAPRHGSVYIIEHIEPNDRDPETVYLVFAGWAGFGWDAREFRPVTDISSLRALLNTRPVDHPELQPSPPSTPTEPATPSVPVLCFGG